VKYLKKQAKYIVERFLGHQVEELLENNINLTLYLTYLKGNLILE